MGVQIPFSFPKSLDFKPLQTKVRILPWQMKSIFIIVLFLLVLPRNALFCKGFWGYGKMLWNYRLWQIRAELSTLLLPVSSKISCKMERVTTKDFFYELLAHLHLSQHNNHVLQQILHLYLPNTVLSLHSNHQFQRNQ